MMLDLQRDTFEKEALKAKVNEIVKISTIPAVLNKIMEVMENDDSTISDLERVIEHDQAIALRVLGISNSVYYGFSGKIGSIHQAILVLGFEMVKGVAISTAVFKGITGGNRTHVTNLWMHSFEVAMAASLIAEKTGLAGREPAFLAGLLHDIGRPILFQVFGKDYMEVSLAEGDDLLAREERAFGAAHTEVGFWFAEKCKLPADCTRSIRSHHSPRELKIDEAGGPTKYLLPIIYVADQISLGEKGCFGEAWIKFPWHSEILKSLNLDQEKIKEVGEVIEGMKEEIRNYYE